MQFDQVETVAQAHPLHTRALFRRVEQGATVAEIVAGFDLPQRFGLPQAHLVRDGQISVVPLDLWRKVRPKAGTRVEISYAVEGPAIPLAAAALSAAAPWVAGTVFGLAAGTFAYTVAVAAITIVGALVLNALIPPVKQPKQDMEQYDITGIQNVENRYGIYPKVLGRHRIYPPKTARGYTETVGRDIYYRGRMTFGWGPVALEDLRIGTTPIHEFDDVELEFLNVDQAATMSNYPELAGITTAWRTGSDSMLLCPDDVAEDGYNIKLLHNEDVVRVTRSRTESASIDIAFPQGLIHFTQKGRRESQGRSFEFWYRSIGSGTWISAGGEYYRARTTSYIRFTKQIVFPEPGTYEIRVRRTQNYSSNPRTTDTSHLSAIRSFRSGNLPSHEGIAEIAFRLRANEQLSGNVDSLNAIVQQMAPIWTGSEWTAPQPVRHPAWLYLAALRGSHLRRPVSDARIDLAALKAWADEEPHWTCDYVIDAETRTAEVLDIIAASGRARRALTDLQYSIIRDGAAGPVRQMFSPRNSWGFKGSIAFPRPIHALRCMVRSERLDWELDEVTVFADGHDETTATEFETLEIPGVVVTAAEEDEGNAWRLGRYHLAQAILRPETYEWHADWEHMRVTRGDKVQLVHDVPLIGVGAARVTAIEGRRNILPSSSVLGAGWATLGGAALTPHAGGLLDARYTATGAPTVYQNLRVTDGIPEHDGVYCISMIGALGPDAGLAEFIRLGDARIPSAGLRYYIEIDQASGEIIDSVRVVDAGRTDLGAGVYRWWLTVDTDEPRSRNVSLAIGVTEVGIGADLFFLGPVQAEKGSAPTPVQTVSDDAAVRALTLDEFYDFASADFRLTVRHEDGARSTFTARSPADQSSRQWTATEPPVAVGDLVFIEEIAQESMEVLVTGIYPDGDNARITAVPAAPAVLQADQGEIPHYRPIITPGRDSALRGPELPIVLQAISDETTMLTLPDGTIQPRIAVTLEPITTAGELGSVQLRWRLDDGDDPWTYGAAFPVGGATFLTEALQRGATYEVSVRVIGSTGRSRGWVDIGAVLAQGTEAPPPDVTGFVVAPVEQQVQLRWDDVEGIPDIAWAEIRYAAAEGATWNTSVLQERVSYPMTTARLFARPGTYLIKWMDWGGRCSSNAAAVYVSRNKIRELNAVEVLECSPDWSGTFDGTLATGEGALVLEKSGDEYPSEGMWTSTTTVDLGAVYPVQITPHIEATGFSALDAMSEWDSLAALPSLASSNPDTWRVDTEVRTSEDGSTWTAWQPVSGGDFVGRHFNFRVRLRSDREDVTPRIDMLAFVLDMPDRVDGIEDVLCPAAGMRISYDPAFRNVPSVVVTPRDAPSGARVEISNKSRGGFDIRFYNSTGTAIAQRFDWVARGYGREVDE